MPAEIIDLDVGEAPLPNGFRLRKYQGEWRDNANADRQRGLSRVCIDAVGGTGKSSAFAALALTEWNERTITGRTGRTLVIENRDGLVHQTAQRIRDETGLEVSIEMAGERASPFAAVVVCSVQTLSKLNRLTGFSDSHFSLVVSDEAHLSTSKTWLRVMNYFHYGAESLADNWTAPRDGTYTPKSFIVGTTATPEEKMGAFYQRFVLPRYTYLQAVDDGWLVPPIAKSVPVKVDLRKFRMGRTPNGTDFRDSDLAAAMIPIVEELAKQLYDLAADRKTICFVPSVECARLMCAALERIGLTAWYISGSCLDRDGKTEEFERAGRGSVLVNCALYVYGKDFPDVDCVAQFRATISRSWFVQGVYRGTRVLPGLVNDDMTAEQRRAAIAASAKPNLLILDPLFVTDRIDLCSYCDLLTDKPEVKKAIQAAGGDPVEEAKKAERDFVAALEKEAKKHEGKLARMINPLAFGLAISDDALAHYQPKEAWEFGAPKKAQLEFIESMGLNTLPVKTAGHADLLNRRLAQRMSMGLVTPERMEKLRRMRRVDKETQQIVPMWTEEQIVTMPDKQARVILWQAGTKQRTAHALKQIQWNRAQGIEP